MVVAYAKFLARYPLAVLVCSIAVCIACMLSVFLAKDPFDDFSKDFANPIKGFETHGTEISQRSLALKNLRIDLDHLRGEHNVFFRYPDEYELARNLSRQYGQSQETTRRPSSRTEHKLDGKDQNKYISKRETRNDNDSPERGATRKANKLRVQDADPRKPLAYCNTSPSQSGSGEEYAMIAFEVIDGSGLFSMSTFTSLCEAEQRLWAAAVNAALVQDGENVNDETVMMSAFMPSDSCQVATKRRCCQPWHLASVAAHLLDKPDCSQLNESDIQWLKSKLQYCRRYAKVLSRCWSSGDSECLKSMSANCSGQAINLLYQYLLPKEYMRKGATAETAPASTLMILPVPKAAYKDLTSGQIERLPSFVSSDNMRLVAMDFGVRDTVFQQYLLIDTGFVLFALCLIFLVMWIYSGSFLFTVAAMVGIVLSLCLAYFVYRMIYGIDFFPFMNLLTCALIIGVGADDAFIFRSAWMKAKFDKNSGTHAKILSDTLSHAAVSMFVTSLTTAAAFFTNVFSNIVAIKCFGLFAGTTILTNYLLVITWLPACVVLSEKRPIFSTSYCWCCPRWCIRQQRRHPHDQERKTGLGERRRSSIFGMVDTGTLTLAGSSATTPRNNHTQADDDDDAPLGRRRSGLSTSRKFLTLISNPIQRAYQELSVFGRVFFQKLLPWLVIKLRVLWLFIFGTIAVLSCVAISYKPSIKLPSKDYFQYFKSSHPFERWEDDVKQRFAFASDNGRVPLVMYVVWGVKPTTDARVFDPHSTGTLQAWPANDDQDLFDNVNLLWLREFCASLAVQNFTRYPSEMPMLASCFVDTFMTVMQRRPCVNPGSGQSQWPCCSEVQFPYPPGVFETCLEKYISIEKPTITLLDMTSGLGPSGPLFSAETGKPTGLVVMFASSYNFTFSYPVMREFYETASAWITERLQSGPSAIRNGWMIADHLQLYDLQRALASGTVTSVLIAVAIASVVLVLTTWNVRLSIMAIMSILFIIVTTIAILVLLGWELNVLESTIISLTIGLSFDFTLHYGVAYKLCPTADDRESRVIYALGEVGSPVFMAFVTTFLAGIAMLPSTTLAYFQIGLFMILETTISWLYATFFFMSLLHCFGPLGRTCQLWSARCSTRQNSGSGGGSISAGGRRISRDIATDAALGAAARRKKSSIVSFNAVAFNTVSCSPLPASGGLGAKINALTSLDYARLETRRPMTAFKEDSDLEHREDEMNHKCHQEFAIVETAPMMANDTSSAPIDNGIESPQHSGPIDNGCRSSAEDDVASDSDTEYQPTDSEVAPVPMSDDSTSKKSVKKPSLKDRAASMLGPVLHRFSVKRQGNAGSTTIELDERDDAKLCSKNEQQKSEAQPLAQDVPFIDGDTSLQSISAQEKLFGLENAEKSE